MISKSDWQPSMASIYSVSWIDASRNDFGHYEVTYSYHVSGEYYTGRFADYASQEESYLKRNDSIQIRYNPENPARSFYPEAQRPMVSKVSLLMGCGLGAIVMLIVYLNGGFN
ncbi:DUF3592 domain-containing protein [Edaphobacter modestus]|uniref:Uncharacterized protein DUF3592 n=1 Tax=Edaphobacter modestus TaxID=388466 RepID=A0A4Q7YSI7_9BACT|nr:DUF3592 domain-containing protein [Edaphobacter modestus]RZU40510.1 uncharacterized protein DUF3592 [Edaphobacter modestus]